MHDEEEPRSWIMLALVGSVGVMKAGIYGVWHYQEGKGTSKYIMVGTCESVQDHYYDHGDSVSEVAYWECID